MAARPAAASRLIAAGTFIAVGGALSAVQMITGWGLPCPWRAATGTLCPFCGATGLGSALIGGDLAGAWTANPFVFVLLAGLGLACVIWIVELSGGPVLRLRGRWADQRAWYLTLGLAALVFMVGRNL